MALYLSNRDGDGKTNEEGHYRLLSRLLDGAVLLDNDLKVTEGSTLGLRVRVSPGDYRIETPLGYSYMGWNSNYADVTIGAPDITNPRISTIVLYIDKNASTSPVPPNNPGIPKLKEIAGTAASSPIAPSDTIIQTQVGTGNPFIKLANINVPPSVTQIVNANITDLRSQIKFINKLLDNIYPVGSIYENADNPANPATLLGFGTWSEFGSGRVTVGKTSSGTFSTAGAVGGSETVSLTEAQNGQHTHTGTTANAGNHAHSGNTGGAGNHAHSVDGGGHSIVRTSAGGTNNRVAIGGGGQQLAWHGFNTTVSGWHAHGFSTNTTGNHSHSFTTANSGTGQPHDNLQPYIVVYRWVRVA